MTRIMDNYGDFTFHAFHSMHFKISEQVSLLYGIKRKGLLLSGRNAGISKF